MIEGIIFEENRWKNILWIFRMETLEKSERKKPYFTMLGKNLVLCVEKLLEFLNKESYLDFKKEAMNGTILKM